MNLARTQPISSPPQQSDGARRIRLLHIVGDSKFGGGSVVILRLAQMAHKAGYDVAVLTTDPVFQNLLRQSGIGVVDLDVIRRDISPWRDLKGLIKLRGYLKKQRYDLVHTHTSKAGFVGRLAAKAAGVRAIIHTVHGLPFHEESSRLACLIYALLERIAAYSCHRLVTVSDFHRQRALHFKLSTPGKLVAIPNGISLDRVTVDRAPEMVRRQLGVAPDTTMLLALGRLDSPKGFDYLLNAVPAISDGLQKPFQLFFVGTGPLETQLRGQAARLGINDRVTFLGFQTEIGNLLAASDVVVLPSLWEGLSIALLEAMAAGKPIVTTSIGSNREATQNGLGAELVPPKDSNAIAQAVIKLVRNPLQAAEKAMKAREIFLEHYGEDRMLDAYHHEYRQLVGSTKTTSIGAGVINFQAPALTNMNTLQRITKRAFDMLIAISALVFLSPLLALIAIAIVLDSRGGVFFRQRRLGRNARAFTVFKFRTMVGNAPDLRNADGSSFNSPRDPRVTRVGRFLRATSLDELPQLLNVLLGSMSLVGPRPDLVDQASFYVGEEWRRTQVKPGITGLAQVNGRNAILWSARKQLDLKYVSNQTLSLDLKIVVQTIPYVVRSRGVYGIEVREGLR